MTRKNVLFRSKEWTSRERVAAFLRELADKVEANTLVLRRDAESVEVELPGDVRLEVEYEEKRKREGAKRTLEIELEWQEGGRRGGEGRVQLG